MAASLPSWHAPLMRWQSRGEQHLHPRPQHESSEVRVQLGHTFRGAFPVDGEHEEVVTRGRDLVWCSGQGIKHIGYTAPSDIMQTLWCVFPKREKQTRYLCVMHRHGIALLGKDGSRYDVSLPCTMHRAWQTSGGLLFQRKLDDSDSIAFPVFFSLTHCLDEVRPIGKHPVPEEVDGTDPFALYITNASLHILFASERASRIVLYDTERKKLVFAALAQHDSRLEITIVSGDEPLKPDFVFVTDVELSCDIQPSSVELCVDSNGNAHFAIFTASLQVLQFFRESGDISKVSEVENVTRMTPLCLRPYSFSEFLPIANAVLVVTTSGNLILYAQDIALCHIMLPESDRDISIAGLSAVYDRVSLETKDGDCLFLGMPSISSRTVADMLLLLQPLLSFSEFNRLRSILICGTSVEAEWEAFSSFVTKMYVRLDQPSSPAASTGAWERMMQSKFAQQFLTNRPNLPQLQQLVAPLPVCDAATNLCVSKSESLRIFLRLHLFYEQMKLFNNSYPQLESLRKLLALISSSAGVAHFRSHYNRDSGLIEHVDIGDSKLPIFDVFHVLLSMKSGSIELPDDYIRILRDPRLYRLRSLLRLYAAYFGLDDERFRSSTQSKPKVDDLAAQRHTILMPLGSPIEAPLRRSNSTGRCEQVVDTLILERWTADDVRGLPFGVALPIQEALNSCKSAPPNDWTVDHYHMIGRKDLAKQFVSNIGRRPPVIKVPRMGKTPSTSAAPEKSKMSSIRELGVFTNPISPLIFNEDARLEEVSKMVDSSRTMTLHVENEAGIGEHELVAVHQVKLLQHVMWSLAKSVGRGMACLAGKSVVLTESLSVPPLNFSGKLSSTNAGVTLDQGSLAPTFSHWGEFHNGVAAGLSVNTSDGEAVTGAWISLNKPAKPTNEHAGFLLGLGLQGALRLLEPTQIYDYLHQNHEFTSVAILVGAGLSYRGEMNSSMAKLLSIHVPALHPPSSTDLELSANLQIAALLGLGLLYQGTQYRPIVEMLVREIDVGPREDPSFNRDSYSLTAGISLGLVLLGAGRTCHGLADINIEQRLSFFMDGRDLVNGDLSRRAATPSGLVLESDHCMLVDIRASGAVYALTLMYLRTNDSSVANSLFNPSGFDDLDYTRSDILLLRAAGRNLVLWDESSISEEWLQSQVPAVVEEVVAQHSATKPDESVLKSVKTLSDLHRLFDLASGGMAATDASALFHKSKRTVHLITALRTKAAVLTGCCLALSLKHAGSLDEKLCNLVMQQFSVVSEMVTSVSAKDYNQYFFGMCRHLLLISASIVMAGSGNLTVLKTIRKLHYLRVAGKLQNDDYGTHMALSMATGFLFLGGGRYSLKTDNSAVAGLLVSIFPLFPLSCNDSQYHLQAFRHLWVSAAEHRCIETIDVTCGEPCIVAVDVECGTEADMHIMKTHAPCLLPPFHTIRKIFTKGSQYYNRMCSDIEELRKQRVIYVQRRLEQVAIQNTRSIRDHLASLRSTECDELVLLAEQLCVDFADTGFDKKLMSSALMESVRFEKPYLVLVYLSLVNACRQVLAGTAPLSTVWSIKFVLELSESACVGAARGASASLEPAFLVSVHVALAPLYARVGPLCVSRLVRGQLGGDGRSGDARDVATVAVLLGVPFAHQVAAFVASEPTLTAVLERFPLADVSVVQEIATIVFE